MILVIPPVQELISVDDLKLHLRVLHDDDDLEIQMQIDSAMSWLDGWDGVLGRCIMPQTWRVTADERRAGVSVPDVIDSTLQPDGSLLVTCAMPVSKRASVAMAVKLLVGHWFENRQVVADRPMNEAPLAVKALLEPLRAWP